MNLVLIVPNVVNKYVASFPENTHGAYPYFNYDHRVVNERVERFDQKPPYKTADQFTDVDFDALVNAAKDNLDQYLAKYSMTVACEDALHRAIRSFENGLFDGKVNASRYSVLLNVLKQKVSGKTEPVKGSEEVEAKKKAPAEGKRLKPHIVRELGLKDQKIPTRVSPTERKSPHIVREKGQIVLKTPKEANTHIGGSVMIKNAQQYSEQLDKIAEEVESINPMLALQIDTIADVIEGKKEASTLKFDSDEAWYMQNRFNSQIRKRDADEKYMDEYNKNDFEQVIGIRKNPVAIKKASVPYQRVVEEAQA